MERQRNSLSMDKSTDRRHDKGKKTALSKSQIKSFNEIQEFFTGKLKMNLNGSTVYSLIQCPGDVHVYYLFLLYFKCSHTFFICKYLSATNHYLISLSIQHNAELYTTQLHFIFGHIQLCFLNHITIYSYIQAASHL